MEIKLDVVLKADDTLLKFASVIAHALSGQAQGSKTTVKKEVSTAPKTEASEKPEPETDVVKRATKIMYFEHDPSGDLFTLKKGDAIPTGEGINELTKQEYLEKKTAVEDSDQETEQNDQPVISIVELRSTFSQLSAAGKQKEGKALLTKLGYKKLSEIPEEERVTVKAQAEEILL